MLPIVTIASKNYLAQVRTLVQSYRKFHPDGQVFVCLVDDAENYFEPAAEPFTLIKADQLNIPRWEHFAFKYNLLELNTAVKPFLLSYLFQTYNLSKIAYFDPDIVIYHSLEALDYLLDEYGIVLTPHILDPIHDQHHPSEMDLLLSGIYNLGFVALSRQTDLDKLLTWWQARLYDYCLRDVQRGLFVDQRWMDFAPALFTKVFIWRNEGSNVAYWNYTHRSIEIHGDSYTINSSPLLFMHYSGLDVNNLEAVSKHQDRFSLADLPHATQSLIKNYRDQLLANGYNTIKTWPYTFDNFDNGKPIAALARTICRELDPHGDRWPTPFRTGPGSFYQYLYRPKRATLKLWKRRAATWTRQVAAVILPPLLGAKQYQRVRQIVFHQPNLKVTTHLKQRKPGSTPHGVNVIGYLNSETGVGEAARSTIRALHSINYPLAYSNTTLGDIARKADFSLDQLSLPQGTPYPINLMHVNADQVPYVQHNLGLHVFEGRYNVGFWFWELPAFPAVWQDRFTMLDEIWVASSWCQRSIGAVSSKPVLVMPLHVEPQIQDQFQRTHFGLAHDKFLFLYTFDALSYVERKNPFGLIRAFRKAFGTSSNIQLVMKIGHLEFTECADQLREAMNDINGVLIDKVMSREEVNSLINSCDAYVSMHRSEGFGLTIAEAMYLGKPVIATGYSSNMDFMTHQNSYPVDYALVPILETVGPYEKGMLWAEPDEDHAAHLMQEVYRHSDTQLTVRAAADIRRSYSLNTTADVLRDRLNILTALMQTR